MRLIAFVAAGMNQRFRHFLFSGKLLLAMGAFLFSLQTASAAPCTCNSADKLSLSGRVAVFYTLSQAELDSLDSDDQQAYSELLGDFYEYAEKLGSYLSANEIRRVTTASPCLEIKTSLNVYCYNTKELSEEVGVIFSDGTKIPKVVPGVFADPEIIPIISDYYSLECEKSRKQ